MCWNKIVNFFRRLCPRRQEQEVQNKYEYPYLKYRRIDHFEHILNKKCIIPEDILERLRDRFKDVSRVYSDIAKLYKRLNFLNYSYVARKILELEGQIEYMNKFDFLTSREKLNLSDMIWRDICHELNWEFIPSIKEEPKYLIPVEIEDDDESSDESKITRSNYPTFY
jgi:hypothetical protein